MSKERYQAKASNKKRHKFGSGKGGYGAIADKEITPLAFTAIDPPVVEGEALDVVEAGVQTDVESVENFNINDDLALNLEDDQDSSDEALSDSDASYGKELSDEEADEIENEIEDYSATVYLNEDGDAEQPVTPTATYETEEVSDEAETANEEVTATTTEPSETQEDLIRKAVEKALYERALQEQETLERLAREEKEKREQAVLDAMRERDALEAERNRLKEEELLKLQLVEEERAAKLQAEEEAKRQAEEEARRQVEEEEKRMLEEIENARRLQDLENERQRKALEEALQARQQELLRKEEELNLLRQQQEEKETAMKLAEEETRRQAEEARRQAEEEARRQAEEEARRQAEEEERRQAEEEARRQAEEEARRQAEEEARRQAEEEARRQAEEEARRQAEEEARRQAEEERVRIQAQFEEMRRQQEEENNKLKQALEEALRIQKEELLQKQRELEEIRENQRLAEERHQAELEEQRRLQREAEERRLAEEARRQAEEEARRQAEEEARRQAEEEARRQAEEEARRQAEEEARRQAEEEARRQAEEEARRQAEEEARRQAEEEARRQAEEEARRQAEEEARRQAEEEARRQAEEEARRQAEEEARRLAEEEARRQAEEEARRLAEEAERIRQQEELEEMRRQQEENDKKYYVEEDEEMYNQANVAKIKVIGVGGAGSNAVNRMIELGVDTAEFVAVNTDKQALLLSLCDEENKIQIGANVTKGLGAGADPTVGEQSAEESKKAIEEAVKGVDLLFIAAGMGGGTGTGAAPIVAKIAKEAGCVTVAVVTRPFHFEGKKREMNAIKGVNNLAKYVDTIIIIPNDRLLEALPADTPFVDALKYADDTLRQGICGIADLIATPSLINLDFADVRTILKNQGLAHMGVGKAKGENRVIEAVRQAVASPLLETTIEGAHGIILNVTGGKDLSMQQVKEAADRVQEIIDPTANIIFGMNVNPELQEEIIITIIATGFDKKVGDDEDVQPKPSFAFQTNNQPKAEPREEYMNVLKSRYDVKPQETNVRTFRNEERPYEPTFPERVKMEEVCEEPTAIETEPEETNVNRDRKLPSFVSKLFGKRN